MKEEMPFDVIAARNKYAVSYIVPTVRDHLVVLEGLTLYYITSKTIFSLPVYTFDRFAD